MVTPVHHSLLILAEAVANSGSQQSGKSAYSRGLFNEDMLVFGGTTDLDSRLTIETNMDVTMRQALRMFGLRTASTVSLTGYENA